MKRPIGLLLLLGIALLVFFITREIYRPDPPTERITSDVLLERIRPVMKLVTVEGDFSELYTYTQADATFDWLKRFSPFQKKAILRVKATASIGYDLEGMGLVFDEASRTVRFTGMGKPQVLALSHDVDYFDLEAGTFNDFTAADHTHINAQAKQLIERKVAGSGLFQAAEAQKGEFLLVLQAVVENGGWRFEDTTASVDGRTRLKG
ncbi:MAG: DUF4230 domain-containing protein [Flavobacteriales bacterium]|nr:DUF4230 domain-containing protein [Flavobacteriales bacterium]